MYTSDMAKRATAALAVACMLSIACASIGKGDKVVVRAEDALVNSLTVYEEAMAFHEKNSFSEPKPVYDAMEWGKKSIPRTWRVLRAAVALYKQNGDASTVDAAKATLDSEVEKLIVAMRGGS